MREAVAAVDEIGAGVIVVIVDRKTGKTACASNLTMTQGQKLLAFAAQNSLNPVPGAVASGDWTFAGNCTNDGTRIGQTFETPGGNP
jgi:hypothetical protein